MSSVEDAVAAFRLKLENELRACFVEGDDRETVERVRRCVACGMTGDMIAATLGHPKRDGGGGRRWLDWWLRAHATVEEREAIRGARDAWKETA